MQAPLSPTRGIAARAGARIAAWLLLGACAQAAAQHPAAPPDAGAAIRVSPQARVLGSAERALPMLSQQLIDTFMAEPEVLTEAEIERAPRLVAAAHTRTLLSAGDLVYARSGAGPALRTCGGPKLYRIFRTAVPLRDPESGAIIGYEAQYLGRARLLRGESTLTSLNAAGRRTIDPVPATLALVSAKSEIRIGDRLLPMPRNDFPSYAARPPHADMRAGVVSTYGGDAPGLAASNQVIAINRGARHDIEPGHVLRLVSRGARMPDRTDARKAAIQLPGEYNGQAMVFRVFERVSYALILDTRAGVRTGDALVSPNFTQ